MTHVDVFSGLGGFSLAAAANGLATLAHCETDKKCRQFLAHAWPDVPCHHDIRSFNGTEYKNAYLLTAGVPCQPISVAGLRRGENDDRWLWPDALRVFAEIRPTWALYENPPGLATMGLARIVSAMENQNYAVRVFEIPACAVGAPHYRRRLWITARSLEDADKIELPLSRVEMQPETKRGKISLRSDDWSESYWAPCWNAVRRAPDGNVGLVDGIFPGLSAAVGNSIVPQVAEKIIAAMIAADREE